MSRARAKEIGQKAGEIKDLRSKVKVENVYLGFFRLHEWRKCKYHVLPRTHRLIEKAECRNEKTNITLAHFTNVLQHAINNETWNSVCWS